MILNESGFMNNQQELGKQETDLLSNLASRFIDLIQNHGDAIEPMSSKNKEQ